MVTFWRNGAFIPCLSAGRGLGDSGKMSGPSARCSPWRNSPRAAAGVGVAPQVVPPGSGASAEQRAASLRGVPRLKPSLLVELASCVSLHKYLKNSY